MTRLEAEAFEGFLRFRNRIRGLGWFPEPARYFGPGGVEASEAACLEAGRDFLSFVRTPERIAPSRLEHDAATGAWRFDSPLPSGRPENDRVEIRVFPARIPRQDDRILVFHHPLYQHRWWAWAWFVEPLRRRYPVAVMAAPFHFGRVPAGEFPAEGFVNPNPWSVFAGMRQWCWDHAAALTLLREHEGLRPAALVGFSLGAFQSILSAAAGSHALPIVSIAATNRYGFGVLHGSNAAGIRKGMADAGITAERFLRMVDAIQLERYAPAVRDRPVLYLTGRWDRVDPPPSGERLAASLAPGRSLTLPAGHASLVRLRWRIGTETLRFVDEL